ncbi:MAG: sensor histidine kinase [Lachnospiraceae bacterium]|nr:sensor histidine kinase [Lachnospiraceae bacterium]
MTFQEFISDHLGKIILQILIMTLVSVILLTTGTQSGIVILLLVILCLIRITVFVIDFIRCRSHLKELESILSGLDQKYLFAECVPQPPTIYERRLFGLMHCSYKSMIGAVSDAQSAQKEYREYVESWVHEIKSPITAAELICHGVDSEPRRRLTQELAQIKAHVERALFYARAEIPEQDFIIRQINLEEIVSETIENYRTLLIQSGIRIETGDLNYPVYTDSKWACFILGQFLQNTARYSKKDTPIVKISAELREHNLILTISDNGIGIPAHELPRVFDRGFTGSNGRARGGSTGMGLYLCRKLSELLGIDLQITSTEHEGTQVMLSFPAKESLTKM